MKQRKIYTLPKDTQPTAEVIKGLIEKHQKDVPAYKNLSSYISTDESPEIERELPNPILTVNDFGGYIVKVNAGYMVGNPIEYTADEKVDIEKLIDAYRTQSISDLDSDLADDLSTFGRAFELVYSDENSQILSTKLSVYHTVVVYDDTVKHEKMFAFTYVPIATDSDNKKYKLTLYTDSFITQYEYSEGVLIEETKDKHPMGKVPIIEYFNNKRLRADHEPVLSLINAYNILQSDRVIDREKLVDALLAITGATMSEEAKKELKNSRAVNLPEGSDIKYITKNIDEADADVLRKTLAQDIHKFSLTPDLSDDQFGNSPSGVSLAYKLMAFEWNILSKEQYMRKGLMDRLALYAHFLNLKSSGKSFSPADVTIVFRHSMPKNDLETSEMINNLVGIVDSETLISRLSFVNQAEDVLKKLEAENENVSDPDDLTE